MLFRPGRFRLFLPSFRLHHLAHRPFVPVTYFLNLKFNRPGAFECRAHGAHTSTPVPKLRELSGRIVERINSALLLAPLCPPRHPWPPLTAVYSVSPWRLKKRFILRLSVAR